MDLAQKPSDVADLSREAGCSLGDTFPAERHASLAEADLWLGFKIDFRGIGVGRPELSPLGGGPKYSFILLRPNTRYITFVAPGP